VSVISVTSTVVELQLTVAGDVSSFDPGELENVLQDALHCGMPECRVSLRISAGSVHIAVVLTIPHDQPRFSNTAAVVETAAGVFINMPSSEITSTLSSYGVGYWNVTAASPTVTVGIKPMPIAVAPPPPKGPPPSPPPCVAIYGNCHNGGSCCAPNSCFRQSEHYSQCLSLSPSPPSPPPVLPPLAPPVPVPAPPAQPPSQPVPSPSPATPPTAVVGDTTNEQRVAGTSAGMSSGVLIAFIAGGVVAIVFLVAVGKWCSSRCRSKRTPTVKATLEPTLSNFFSATTSTSPEPEKHAPPVWQHADLNDAGQNACGSHGSLSSRSDVDYL